MRVEGDTAGDISVLHESSLNVLNHFLGRNSVDLVFGRRKSLTKTWKCEVT